MNQSGADFLINNGDFKKTIEKNSLKNLKSDWNCMRTLLLVRTEKSGV